MTNLELYTQYYIKISDTYNPFTVEKDTKGYYLEFPNSNNRCLFHFSKINAIDFTEKILGYYNGGMFPYCNTIDDLTRLLSELLKEMENLDFTFTCNFKYKDPNLYSYWND